MFHALACRSSKFSSDHLGILNDLMPVVSKVIQGDISVLNLFGSDYGTSHSTGIRDFIHVSDLAKGHLAVIWTIYYQRKFMHIISCIQPRKREGSLCSRTSRNNAKSRREGYPLAIHGQTE